MAAARAAPTKAFLVFLPNNDTTVPPLANDPTWGLGDGGSWKSTSHFPVYALPGADGDVILKELGLYSGNVTTVPHGHDLASMYPPTDYIRLWTTIDTGSGSQLPSLWVFLVVVLGLLILVIGSTSFIMHVIQRKRRNRLRQRVINGEVDLEALGIKRLTVPQQYLDKMPLYIYTLDPSLAKEMEVMPSAPPPALTKMSPSPSPLLPDSEQVPIASLVRRSSVPSSTAANIVPHPAFQQPTCAICLDDFIPNTTPVRELPCRHIFHPDCVDSFLLRNSSLCPMCKNSTLPSGSCPATITNAMVRQERMIRRLRERVRNGNEGVRGGVRQFVGGLGWTQSPVRDSSDAQTRTTIVPTSAQAGGLHRGQMRSIADVVGGRRVFSAPDIEMGETATSSAINAEITEEREIASGRGNASATSVSQTTPSTSNSATISATCPSPPPDNPQTRREWARQRALVLLGTRRDLADGIAVEDDETNRRRVWRRVVGKVFPAWA